MKRTSVPPSREYVSRSTHYPCPTPHQVVQLRSMIRRAFSLLRATEQLARSFRIPDELRDVL